MRDVLEIVIKILIIFVLVVCFYFFIASIGQPQTVQITQKEKSAQFKAMRRQRAMSDCSTRMKIVSLTVGDRTAIKGSASLNGGGVFVLGIGVSKVGGSGKIEGQSSREYFFYEDLGEDRYIMRHVPAETTIIKEIDGEATYVVEKNCLERVKENRLEVPRGTIVREFSL